MVNYNIIWSYNVKNLIDVLGVIRDNPAQVWIIRATWISPSLQISVTTNRLINSWNGTPKYMHRVINDLTRLLGTLILFISLFWFFNEEIVLSDHGIYFLYLPGGLGKGDSVMGASDCLGSLPCLHLQK